MNLYKIYRNRPVGARVRLWAWPTIIVLWGASELRMAPLFTVSGAA